MQEIMKTTYVEKVLTDTDHPLFPDKVLGILNGSSVTRKSYSTKAFTASDWNDLKSDDDNVYLATVDDKSGIAVVCPKGTGYIALLIELDTNGYRVWQFYDGTKAYWVDLKESGSLNDLRNFVIIYGSKLGFDEDGTPTFGGDLKVDGDIIAEGEGDVPTPTAGNVGNVLYCNSDLEAVWASSNPGEGDTLTIDHTGVPIWSFEYRDYVKITLGAYFVYVPCLKQFAVALKDLVITTATGAGYTGTDFTGALAYINANVWSASDAHKNTLMNTLLGGLYEGLRLGGAKNIIYGDAIMGYHTPINVVIQPQVLADTPYINYWEYDDVNEEWSVQNMASRFRNASSVGISFREDEGE